MLEHYTATHTLGLVFDAHVLKGASVAVVKKKTVIEKLFTLPFEERTTEEHVKPLDMEGGESVAHYAQQHLVVSGIPSSATLVRSLDLKLTKDRDIQSVLSFQAEPLLPYPVENAVLDSQKILGTSNGTQLTLFAARKDLLKTHFNRLQSYQIEPEVTSTIPAALSVFSLHFAQAPNQPLFVIHMDRMETTCVLAAEGKLLAAHSFPHGVQHLAAGLAKDKQVTVSEASHRLNHLNFSQITAETDPSLYQAWENLKLEIARTLLALTKQAKIAQTSEVLLTGEGGILPGIAFSLSQILNTSVGIPKSGMGQEPPALQEYAAAIGLALSAIPDVSSQINFRQQEFAYPNPWKRFKIPMMAYFGLCLAAAVALFLYSNIWAGYQQDKLKQEYVTILAEINKPYLAFENEYLAKTGRAGEDSVPIEKLSSSEIQDRLEYLQKEIQATPDIFPLVPNVPRVSDVLAWLASHPNVVLNGKKDEPLLQIENFSYAMVKRPEQNKKQEKYQVKIELEFTTTTPKLAREFHDALIAPNDLVDPKAEIKWNSSRDRYRTSFFLKDKTVYPSSGG